MKSPFPGTSQFDTSRRTFEADSEPIFDPFSPRSWLRAARRIRTLTPDLLIVQWWSPIFAIPLGICVRLAKRHGRPPVVFICHNIKPHEQLPAGMMLSRFAFASADRFVVHSDADLRNLQAIRPNAMTHTLFLPINEGFGAAMTKEEARRQLGLRSPTILFFGLIRRYKGLMHLLRAMPLILKAMECTLLIVGEFYEGREEYVRLIQSLGISARVRLIDRYIANEEVALYFCAADLVVLPNTSATQSAIIPLAYSFERPVITTRVGGLPEAVIDGETGFVVDPADPAALAEAIERFYREGREVEFIEGIRKERERFSWGRYVQGIEALIER
ncbi:MAG: glycosyltransferase [Acidobacteria bacterium]|nr:glycosyltransferase [Acidobacteriota bacterium]